MHLIVPKSLLTLGLRGPIQQKYFFGMQCAEKTTAKQLLWLTLPGTGLARRFWGSSQQTTFACWGKTTARLLRDLLCN